MGVKKAIRETSSRAAVVVGARLRGGAKKAEAAFPAGAPRVGKASRGATPVATTPVRIVGHRSPDSDEDMRARLAHVLGPWALAIRGIAVRFTDLNGPRRYGPDTRCSIQVEVPNRPPVVVTGEGAGAIAAFAYTLPRVGRALRHALSRAGIHVRPGHVPGPRPEPPLENAPSLFGRREGRSALDLELALARPEKVRRDLFTDTAQPGVSASDRRAGGGHSARRNTRRSRAGMTASLEDSLGRPSRKSTRRSANRGKPSQGKERTAVARAVTPSARSGRRG